MRETTTPRAHQRATRSGALLAVLLFTACDGGESAPRTFEPVFAAETDCTAAYWPELTSDLEAACDCELTLLVEPSGTFGDGCITQYIRVGEGQVLLAMDPLQGSPDDDPLAIYRAFDGVVDEPAIGDESVLVVVDDPVTGAAITLYARYGNALLTLTTPRSEGAPDYLIDEAAVQAIGERWVQHLASLP